MECFVRQPGGTLRGREIYIFYIISPANADLQITISSQIQ